MQTLFHQAERSDASPARFQEPLFHFLNRVDTPYWENVRHLLEEWLAALPDSVRPNIAARFRKSDDSVAISAFWEVYVSQLLHQMGFEVDLEPEFGDLRPDFLAVDGDSGQRIYVEATVVGEPQREVKNERRLAALYDGISAIANPDFRLYLEVLRQGRALPNLKRLRHDIGNWLMTLRAENIALGPDVPLQSFPERGWHDQQWQLLFRAIPRLGDRNQPSARILQLWGPAAGRFVNDHVDVRESLRRKARKYRETGLAYVVAVNLNRWTASTNSLHRALFGAASEHGDQLLAGRILFEGRAEEFDGLWLTRRGIENRHVSAVLTGLNVSPHSIASVVSLTLR